MTNTSFAISDSAFAENRATSQGVAGAAEAAVDLPKEVYSASGGAIGAIGGIEVRAPRAAAAVAAAAGTFSL
jgi:hypothetical protein